MQFFKVGFVAFGNPRTQRLLVARFGRVKGTLPILTTPVYRVLDDNGERVLGRILVRTLLTLPIEDGFVCGIPRDGRNRLSLLRVLPIAEWAPLADLFLLLRADRINRYLQCFSLGFWYFGAVLTLNRADNDFFNRLDRLRDKLIPPLSFRQ